MAGEYHEAGLSAATMDLHRAIISLVEELEAVDWYQQRIDVAGDEELKGILAHNRDEEIDHAVMALEWLRRKLPYLDGQLRKYLFTTGPIHELHEREEAHGRSAAVCAGDLGIGGLK
jgi:ferritin-like protein